MVADNHRQWVTSSGSIDFQPDPSQPQSGMDIHEEEDEVDDSELDDEYDSM
jgi:hypothetical protein